MSFDGLGVVLLVRWLPTSAVFCSISRTVFFVVVNHSRGTVVAVRSSDSHCSGNRANRPSFLKMRSLSVFVVKSAEACHHRSLAPCSCLRASSVICIASFHQCMRREPRSIFELFKNLIKSVYLPLIHSDTSIGRDIMLR